MQGCVYLKMSSVEYSLKAYKALHGGWYKGRSEYIGTRLVMVGSGPSRALIETT